MAQWPACPAVLSIYGETTWSKSWAKPAPLRFSAPSEVNASTCRLLPAQNTVLCRPSVQRTPPNSRHSCQRASAACGPSCRVTATPQPPSCDIAWTRWSARRADPKATSFASWASIPARSGEPAPSWEARLSLGCPGHKSGAFAEVNRGQRAGHETSSPTPLSSPSTSTPRGAAPYVHALGKNVAADLFLAFGGSTIYLPERPRAGSRLIEAIGKDAVASLFREFGGGHLKVPMAKAWLARHLNGEGGSAPRDRPAPAHHPRKPERPPRGLAPRGRVMSGTRDIAACTVALSRRVRVARETVRSDPTETRP